MAEKIIIAVLLAGLIGIAYSLRRVLLLEKKIANMEQRILKAVKKK